MENIYTYDCDILGYSISKLHFHEPNNLSQKGRFLVNNKIWNLFSRTGDVEAYLLLKQLENEQVELDSQDNNQESNVTLVETKM